MRGVLTSAALLVLVAGVGGQTPERGVITGHVTLMTRVRGAALPSNVYQPRAVGRHEPPPLPEINNVVVSLKGVSFAGALPTVRQEIRQEHEGFLPRVVAVTRGSSVEFPNADPVFHNVFSLSSAATFDLGRYPMGKTKGARFNKAGLVKVYCHIHSQMSASILVLDHPYFAVPSADGTFTLKDVPAGTVTVAGWHERVGERTVQVDVRPGKASSIELSLPVEDLR